MFMKDFQFIYWVTCFVVRPAFNAYSICRHYKAQNPYAHNFDQNMFGVTIKHTPLAHTALYHYYELTRVHKHIQLSIINLLTAAATTAIE